MSNSLVESMSQSSASRQLTLLQPGHAGQDNSRNFSSELERSIQRTSSNTTREPAQQRQGRSADAHHAERQPHRHDASQARRNAADKAAAPDADKIAAARKALAEAVEKMEDGKEEPASIAALTSILAALQSESRLSEPDLEALDLKTLKGQAGNGVLLQLTQLMDGGEEGRGKPDGIDALLRQLAPAARGLDAQTALNAQQLQPQAANGSFKLHNADALALNPDALPLEKTLLSAERDGAPRLINMPGQEPLQASVNAPASNPAGAARSEAAPLPQLPVQTPVSQKAWADDMGNRLAWMVGRNESKAELVLTPPNMGKLSVSLQVNGDQTNAQFVTANQAAREALEQAIPRLREALQQAGINLGQADVNTSSEQQARGGGDDMTDSNEDGRHSAGSGGAELADGSLSGTGLAAQGWRSGLGAIDTFA